MFITTPTSALKKVAVAAAGTLALLALPCVASAAPGPVTAPAIAGTPAMPGPTIDAGQPAATMQALKIKPDIAPAGTKLAFTASGLPANKDVTIAWSTANVRYVLDAKPDSVDYIGRKVDKVAVALAKG